MTDEEKIKEIESALQVITKHCPCYGKRIERPIYIEIGNGIILRDDEGVMCGGGINNVAKWLFIIGEQNPEP